MATPIIVPFPAAGTATIRANAPSVEVNASVNHELIICTITVVGSGTPAFVFKRGGVLLHTADQFSGHPKKRYQWMLTDMDGTLPLGRLPYTLAMSFLGGPLKYTYVMEHCDEFGARKDLLKDIDYESANPSDTRGEPILIEVL